VSWILKKPQIMKCKIWISTIQMHVDSVLVTLSIFQPTGHGPHGCVMAFSPTRLSAVSWQSMLRSVGSIFWFLLTDASITVNLIIKHHGYWLTSLIKNIVKSKKWLRREICLVHRPWIGGKGQPGKKLEGASLAGAHEMSMWPCDMSITPIASRFPHSIILHSLHG
jgi:hypothetical protein